MNRLFVFLVSVVLLFLAGCEFSNPPAGPDIKDSAPKLNITIQEEPEVGSLAKVATCGPEIPTYCIGAPVYLYVMDYQGVLVYDPFYMGDWGGSYNVAQIPFTPGTYKLIATVGGIAAPGILSGAIDGQDYQSFHYIVYDEEFGTAPAGLPVHVITLAKVDGVPTLKQGESTLSQVKKYMIYYFGASSITDDLGNYFGSNFSNTPSHPEMKDYWLRPPSQANPMQFSSNLTDNIYRLTGGDGPKVVPMNFSTTFMDSLNAWYMGLYIFERKPGDISGYYFSFTQVKDPQNPILGFFATGPDNQCLFDPKNKELVTVFDKSTSQNNEHYVLVCGFWNGVNVGDDNRLVYLGVGIVSDTAACTALLAEEVVVKLPTDTLKEWTQPLNVLQGGRLWALNRYSPPGEPGQDQEIARIYSADGSIDSGIIPDPGSDTDPDGYKVIDLGFVNPGTYWMVMEHAAFPRPANGPHSVHCYGFVLGDSCSVDIARMLLGQ